jgi:hypothetical protein
VINAAASPAVFKNQIQKDSAVLGAVVVFIGLSLAQIHLYAGMSISV